MAHLSFTFTLKASAPWNRVCCSSVVLSRECGDVALSMKCLGVVVFSWALWDSSFLTDLFGSRRRRCIVKGKCEEEQGSASLGYVEVVVLSVGYDDAMVIQVNFIAVFTWFTWCLMAQFYIKKDYRPRLRNQELFMHKPTWSASRSSVTEIHLSCSFYPK